MKRDALPPSEIPAVSLPVKNETRREFIERALHERDAERSSGVYVTSDVMLARLDDALIHTQRKAEREPPVKP